MQYFAVIGDLIASRKIAERHAAQEELKSRLTAVNKKYRSVLVSAFSLTLGDEFQGLLKPEAPLFKIIDELILALAPHQIRFGIGVGTILTQIDPKQSIGADGPAYWHARAAIQQVHEKDDYGNTRLAVQLADETQATPINALISTTEFIKASWRSSQCQVFEALLQQDIYGEQFEHGPIASQMGIRNSAFSKRLKSSGIKLYFRSRKAALDLLRAAAREEDHHD